MLLSKKDIERLENIGFRQEMFAHFDKQGYATLKNTDGYCIFYDRKGKQCSVYFDRPSGCRVYPVIFDEEKGIFLDSICPSCNTVTEVEKQRKGKEVVELLEDIDSEATKRRLRL